VVADLQLWARDLVNETPSDLSPESLADRMAVISGELGLEIVSMGNEELKAGGFGGLIGVNAGSAREARMLEVTYTPDSYTKTLAIVGKGIVFDSGGLSLKPAASMMAMKDDMAGAAAVLAGVQAVASLGLGVRVIAIAPLTDNLPSGTATRPGDVLTIRNGKTIEVLNTDAEGRLVLADALSLAVEREPDLILDLATLTGHCHIALGDYIAGAFGRDEDAMAAVLAAGDLAGERLWRLPLPVDHRKMIESDVADMKNTMTGSRYGGHIAAALLLAEFVGEVPWVHLDIAGPAWSTGTSGYIRKGGTGFGVRTIVELARSLAN
jgi:leucyl aminopeptidase